MTPLDTEQELENLQQAGTAAGNEVWAVAELLGNIPMDVAGRVWKGIGQGLDAEGFDAFFKPGTGFRVLYVRERS